MFKVIKYFTDLQDNNHAYNVGDTFPREGLAVSDDRLAELASDKNKRKMPLIEEITEETLPEETTEEKPKAKRAKKKG